MKPGRGRQSKAALLIDTTELNTFRAVLSLSQRLSERRQTTDFQSRDAYLVFLRRFLRVKKVRLSQLGCIIVFRGPGPFTAVRVGVTVANTLGLALNIPVFGVRKSRLSPDEIFLKSRTQQIKLGSNITPYYNQRPNITHPRKND